MGIFRSEAMEHGTLIIPTDRAVEIVTLLGIRGEVMIQDMNATSMKRPYRRYVQRIEEIERQLRYLLNEISKLPGAKIIAGDIEHFLSYDGFVLEGVEESLKTLTDQFLKFRSNNDDLMLQSIRAVMNRAVAKVAAKSLGSKRTPESLVGGANPAAQGLLSAADAEANAAAVSGSPGFSAFAGVVKQEDVDKLTRTIFRATRGNAFTYYESVDEEDSQHLSTLDGGLPGSEASSGAAPATPRNVFVVYYPGGEGSAMHEKISRICRAFGIETFDWSRTSDEAREQIEKLTEVINDKTKALEAFEEYFFEEVAVLLQPVHPGGNSLIEDWRLFCLKQKAIYGCLNLFEETDATLRADCWYPAKSDEKIRELLRQSTSNGGTVSAFLLTDSEGSRRKNPPTFTKVNEFTECFQNMVDTYGIPRYQEANPALLTTVTFPFLFGVMYGDVGHGIIVTLFGLLLILHARQKNKGVKQEAGAAAETIVSSAKVGGGEKDDEVFGLIIYGRYMIFLMGLFAIYAGFVYNDFFSLGFNIYGSRYKVKTYATADDDELLADLKKGVTRYTPVTQPDLPVLPSEIHGAAQTGASKSFPYPFGMDPVWKDADNELDMLNSFKMKLSVIIGFIHMMFGTVTKGLNAVYFKDQLTLWFEFVPQFIFMTCFVGYMDLLIIMKWCQTYYGQPRASIISSLINMAMFKKLEDDDKFYESEQSVERVLIYILIVCIPWMLLCKPILAKLAWNRHHRKTAAAAGAANGGAGEDRVLLEHEMNNPNEDDALVNVVGDNKDQLADGEEGETFEFGEEFIHQTIETIEFVLGAISNTASYLRLWALSLAHQQLASVFFDQIMMNIVKYVVKPAGGMGNTITAGISVFFGFAVFAAITFGIMLCMDTLECYLHALRLHWVEYQNKFFKADGYRFVPFSFYRILTGADVE